MRTILALILFIAAPTHAKTVKLFHLVDGHVEQAIDYNALVEKISPGDSIEFSNGKSFQVQELLGHGETTQVWSIRGDRSQALRIPIQRDVFNSELGQFAPTQFMTEFIEGARPLQESGVPMVKILEGRSGEYALVERLQAFDGKKVLTLDTFLKWKILASSEHKHMAEQVLTFAQGLSAFDTIADFKAEQVGWDPKSQSWKLMDWLSSHAPYTPKADVTDTLHPFEKMNIPSEDALPLWSQRIIARASRYLRHARQTECLFSKIRRNSRHALS